MSPAAPEIRFFSTSDGYGFAVRVWSAPSVSLRIVFLHGIISHGGWYDASSRSLAEAGSEVHFLDRRGSGLNLAFRGDVPHYETWLTDVEAYLESLPADSPRILLGISWGGKVAAAVAARRPDLLAGVGLICPGIYARQQPSAWQRAALAVGGLVGLKSRTVAIPLKDPALFTAMPAWQDYVGRDPLTLRRVTVRFASEDRKLTNLARMAAESITVPTLVILAGREGIVDNEEIRAYFARIAAPDKTLLEYPEAGHTLEFDPASSQYVDDLRRWTLRIAGEPRREL